MKENANVLLSPSHAANGQLCPQFMRRDFIIGVVACIKDVKIKAWIIRSNCDGLGKDVNP
jgi:hypothetical protein